MKSKVTDGYANILDLPEAEIENVKNRLIADGNIIEKSAIKNSDAKFFQAVLTETVFLKFFLFFGFALFAVLNLSGMILSVIYNGFNLTTLIMQTIGCGAILLICFVIFRNIDTNKKTEREAIYIDDGNFIFNFNLI